MNGLDTNILVRVAVSDDPGQTEIAKDRLRSLTLSQPGFISHIVLVEIWWVLTRAYKKTPKQALAFLTQLTETATLVIQDCELVRVALAAARERRADFADALIVAVGASHNCTAVQTFDSNAIKHAGMAPLPAETTKTPS